MRTRLLDRIRGNDLPKAEQTLPAPTGQPVTTLAPPAPRLPPPPPTDAYAALVVPTDIKIRAQAGAIYEAMGQLPLAAVGSAEEGRVLEASLALSKIGSLYGDGRIEPEELGPLTRSALALDEVLAIRDTGAVEGLDPKLRATLDEQLFTPLAELSKLARRHAERGFNPVRQNPMAEVLASLDAPATVRAAQPGADGFMLMRAGGAETTGVEVMQAQGGRAAVFTNKGYDYAPYNEDAGGVGALGKTMFLTSCDQAGGMGKIPGRDGATSELAAQAIQRAAMFVELGTEPDVALKRGVHEAHEAIVALNEQHHTNALTTLTGAVVRDGVAYVVSVGDSQLLHFSKDGTLKNGTDPDNVMAQAVKGGDPNAGLYQANMLTHCVGDVGREAEPKIESWAVEPGDYLVALSDGVLDANLGAAKAAYEAKRPWSEYHEDVTRRDLGGLVRQASTPEGLTAAIARYAINQAVSGDGKSDNTTVTVLQLA